jgi:hypothetical protein
MKSNFPDQSALLRACGYNADHLRQRATCIFPGYDDGELDDGTVQVTLAGFLPAAAVAAQSRDSAAIAA